MERIQHTQHGWDEDKRQRPDEKDFESLPNLVYTEKDFNVKNAFSVTDQEVNIRGVGLSVARTLVSGSAYSAASRDYIMGVTSLALAPTLGLPRPKLVGMGKTYIVKDEVGGAATTSISVVSQGEETIDGATTSTINSNYGSKSYYTDGANWFTF